MENLVINFFGIWSIKKVYVNCCILAQIVYLGKSVSWDMGQNALGQSDCKILKSNLSLEQKDEKAWFFACWYRFMEFESSLKSIDVSIVKSGHSGL